MSGGQVGRYLSPLRYPGGKGKLANYLKLVFLENDLLGSDYVEPYAGGASVALALLFEDYAQHVHINDLNPGVHAFWRAVLEQPDELCSRIRKANLTIREWHRQKAVYSDPTAVWPDVAWAAFYLNRVNRSGIISGGIIGGTDQTGPWTMEARFNRENLIRRIQKVHRFRSRITLSQEDGLTFLEGWANDESTAFIYLDPPYYVKGEGLYDNFYSHDDHLGVAAVVRSLDHPWIVTYDAAPEILTMYEGEHSRRYELSYSAGTRQHGSEVMFASKGLYLPPGQVAGVSGAAVQRARVEATQLTL